MTLKDLDFRLSFQKRNEILWGISIIEIQELCKCPGWEEWESYEIDFHGKLNDEKVKDLRRILIENPIGEDHQERVKSAVESVFASITPN